MCEAKEPENTEGKHYQVLLFDLCGANRICINTELVKNIFANWANDSTKKYLLDKSYFKVLEKDYNGDTENYVNNTNQPNLNECCDSSDDEVWTDKEAVDSERISEDGQIREYSKESVLRASGNTSIIDTLLNGDFDFEWSPTSFKEYSKDVRKID